MRRREDYDTACVCGGDGKGISCPRHEPALCVTPSGSGLRPHRTMLGSPRMSYDRWAAQATLYTWPLWRNWTPPVPLVVETTAEIVARQTRGKPAEYTWPLWSARSRRARFQVAA